MAAGSLNWGLGTERATIMRLFYCQLVSSPVELPSRTTRCPRNTQLRHVLGEEGPLFIFHSINTDDEPNVFQDQR